MRFKPHTALSLYWAVLHSCCIHSWHSSCLIVIVLVCFWGLC